MTAITNPACFHVFLAILLLLMVAFLFNYESKTPSRKKYCTGARAISDFFHGLPLPQIAASCCEAPLVSPDVEGKAIFHFPMIGDGIAFANPYYTIYQNIQV
jgi:hypothetical protein